MATHCSNVSRFQPFLGKHLSGQNVTNRDKTCHCTLNLDKKRDKRDKGVSQNTIFIEEHDISGNDF